MRVLTAIAEFWRRYGTIIISLAAAGFAGYFVTEVMRRLDDRRRGRIGWPAAWAPLLGAIVLLTTGSAKFAAVTGSTFNAPYVVASSSCAGQD